MDRRPRAEDRVQVLSEATPDSGADSGAARWSELLTPALASRVGLVVLGIWLNAADGMVTATIMPSVARDLGGYVWFAWAVVGFQLGCILAAASAGRAARRLGLRRAMILAAGVYAAGCAASAAAPAIGVFLAGRMLQGVGAGWIVGFAYVAINTLFPQRLWSRVFGLGAGVWGVASLLGPLVGGVFAAAGHWRWVFSGFAAQAVLFALAAAALLRPHGRAGAAAAEAAIDDKAMRAPWRTLVVLALAVLAVAGADVSPSGLAALGFILGGLGLFAVALRVNGRPGEGLIPRHAARPSTTAGAGYATIVCMSAASAAFNVYGAAILQARYGLSPLTAGYVVAVDAFGWTAAAFVVAGQPLIRHRAFIRAGAGVILAGVTGLSLSIGSGRLALVIAAAAVMGVGFGLSWSLLSQRIVRSLPEAERSIAASALPTVSMVGGAIGAALAGAVANLLGLARAFTPERAGALGPALFAAFIPLAALGCLAALQVAKRSGVDKQIA